MELSPLRLSVSSKSILAVAAVFLSIPLLAMPGYAASATTEAHLQLVSVNANLTTRLDSKSAKPGERVTAKLTSSVKAADSMDLPKGTVLIGRVAHVQTSTDHRPSKISVVFDQARLNDGHTIAIKATLLGAYPATSWSSFNYTGIGGPYVATQSRFIPYDQKIDQEPGTLSHVAMRSAVQSPVSGVFTSKDRNVDLHRGTQLQFAIAPATGTKVS